MNLEHLLELKKAIQNLELSQQVFYNKFCEHFQIKIDEASTGFESFLFDFIFNSFGSPDDILKRYEEYKQNSIVKP